MSIAAARRLVGALVAASSAALLLAGACGYEGRSLDLFPSAALLGDIARCASAIDCPDNRSFCAEGLCVECLSDAECSGNRPACLAGVCVTCSRPEHCPAASFCNVAAQRCAPACGDAAVCSGATATCDLEQGFCVECLTDGDCPEPGRPACDRPAGQCVACTGAEHCSGARPVCDPARHQCVECSGEADCAGGGRCNAMRRCQRDCTADAGDAGCMTRPPRP